MLQLNSGVATRQEKQDAMPADALVEAPMGRGAHAITINASPELTWPWLAQMGGGGRAGWYSHDWIDNDGHPSATIIRPDLQANSQGDIMAALFREIRAFRIATFNPPRDLDSDGGRGQR